jgi:hypothetical protein
MKLLLDACARLWQFLRDIVTVLRPCRFSALVVAAGVALLLSGQGLEFTVRLPAEGAGKTFWFHACVFLWAFQSWFWARLILDLTFGDRDAALVHPRADRLKAIIRQTPRVLAAGSYLVAVAVCLRAGTALIGALLAAEAVLFYAFLVLRIGLVRSVASGATGWRRLLLLRGSGDPDSLRSLPLLSILVLALTLAAAVAATAWVCSDAVGFGWYFGAAAVPFLGFSMIVPAGSLLVLWASEGGRKRLAEGAGASVDTAGGYPVITLLLLLAIGFSFFPALDNHRVRTIPSEGRAPVALGDFLDRWHAQAPASPDKRANFVVVATAGGGLRAAFWTATVLGAIQDGSGRFASQLAGISGVSGGSLGAAVFVTLVERERSIGDARKDCGSGEVPIGAYQCAGETVLSQDFLAPPAASFLFADLMQRFVPVGFPDRAQALEQSWERAWGQAGFSKDVWASRGLLALWAGERFVPALLLNATHVETGKRVITSPLDIGASPGVFRDAYDLHRMLPEGADLRPSTAAHNSARFTYLSPAGTLPDGTHLVDGGYFENFGAVTARELLKAAVDRWRGRIRPIAILISNDPELEARDLPAGEPQPPRAATRETWGAEALSPLRALLHTRDARGLLAASELRAFAEQNGGRYFQFRLCREPGRPDPALGWVLSTESEDLMREQLRSDVCGNAGQLKELVDSLRSQRRL